MPSSAPLVPTRSAPSDGKVLARWLADRRVATKVTGAVLVAAVVALVVGIVRVSGINAVSAKTDDIYQHGMQPLSAAAALRYDVLAVRYYSLSHDAVKTTQAAAAAANNRVSAEHAVAADMQALSATELPGNSRDVLARVQADWTKWLDQRDNVGMPLVQQGKGAEFEKWRATVSAPLLNRIFDDWTR